MDARRQLTPNIRSAASTSQADTGNLASNIYKYKAFATSREGQGAELSEEISHLHGFSKQLFTQHMKTSIIRCVQEIHCILPVFLPEIQE